MPRPGSCGSATTRRAQASPASPGPSRETAGAGCVTRAGRSVGAGSNDATSAAYRSIPLIRPPLTQPSLHIWTWCSSPQLATSTTVTRYQISLPTTSVSRCRTPSPGQNCPVTVVVSTRGALRMFATVVTWPSAGSGTGVRVGSRVCVGAGTSVGTADAVGTDGVFVRVGWMRSGARVAADAAMMRWGAAAVVGAAHEPAVALWLAGARPSTQLKSTQMPITPPIDAFERQEAGRASRSRRRTGLAHAVRWWPHLACSCGCDCWSWRSQNC
jgi:hypothetical protein